MLIDTGNITRTIPPNMDARYENSKHTTPSTSAENNSNKMYNHVSMLHLIEF